MSEPTPIRDFGYANGFRENPPEIAACEAQGHALEVELLNSRGTLHRYTCPICRISYKIDSSD